MIIVETGPLVAAAIANDDHHHACVELFTGAHLAKRPLLVSPLVVAEVSYLLEREAGSRVVAEFLRSLRDGDFALADLTRQILIGWPILSRDTPIFRWVRPMPPW